MSAEFRSEHQADILIPQVLMEKIRPFIDPSSLVNIRLQSGKVIARVAFEKDTGRLLGRSTGLKGPEWTDEGLDFKSDDIEAVGVYIPMLRGFFGRTKWFER